MFTEKDLQDIRAVEPFFREGMTAAEIVDDMCVVRRWDDLMDDWRFAGNRPKSEQLVDHRTARRLEKQAARNRKYRKNKKLKAAPCVTLPM